MVRLSEQPRSAAGAGEQQCPGGAAAAEGGGFPLQGAPEILIGRVGVPDVELHGLAHLHLLSHRDGSRSGVGAGDAADQEVPLARLGLVLVDDHPHVRALGEQLLLPVGQRGG